jgi:hypothetical protein
LAAEGETVTKPWYTRRRYQVIAILLIVLLVLSVLSYVVPHIASSPPTDGQIRLNKAISYFANNYNFTTGLIPEKPGSDTFWLYSDNYLASLAIFRYTPANGTTTDFAEALEYAVAGYASLMPTGILNQYEALNSTDASFACSNNYTLSWSRTGGGSPLETSTTVIETTVNDGSPHCAAPSQNYADLLFLQAVYYHRVGNSTAASEFYNLGVKDFDGIGINDTAFTSPGPSQGEYQTYKVALYIYASVCLGQSTSDSNFSKLKPILLSQQDNATGGFYTGYTAALGHGSSTVNTETTALAALALELLINPTGVC